MKPPPACGHWIGAERRRCGATENVARYVNTTACPAHTPTAIAGRTEAPTRT